MATLNVPGTTDYSGQTLNDITEIIFTPVFTATATFAASQFDNTQISTAVALTGSVQINQIVVNGGDIDASGWTFPSWAPTDLITLNGSAAADTIVGSSQKDIINGLDQNDTITGGLGADTLNGGEGNDTFVYNTSAELAAGETIDGGAGTGDILRVNVGQGFTLNVSGAGVLTDLEKVVFAQAGGLRLAGENVGIGAGLINSVTGSSGTNVIESFDSFVDLSGLTFANWTAGVDTIFFGGTAGNDTLIGSGQDDQFSYSSGVDALSGGGGNDVFSVSFNVFAAGASINGGSGTDEISTSGADLSLGTVTGVERLIFFDVFAGGPGTTVNISVAGTQVRAGAIDIVDGGNFIDTLTVKGASVNLSGVAFTQWTAGTDKIVINGVNGVNNTLIGSSQRDTINGGNRNDTLNGGAGIDILKGGLGNDTYILGADTGDTITDTGGIDTVTSTISRSLSGGLGAIENLTLLGSATTGAGNAVANTLLGNAAGNTLDGGDGGDTLGGGDGKDTLIGGLGLDRMSGGKGVDTFAFLTIEDTGKKAKLADIILDFTASDFINLKAIDARKGGANNKFKFIGKKAFSEKAGQLKFQKKKGDVIVSGDVNGDGKADFSILLDNVRSVAKSDFLL